MSMTDTEQALVKFSELVSNVDDLSSFVTGVMNIFDEIKASGQRSEIEIGLENWMNPEAA